MHSDDADDASPGTRALSVQARWLRRVRAERFETAGPAWLDRFAQALRDAQGDETSHDRTDAGWPALGLEARRGDRALWLRERAPAVGRGAFALRAAPARDILVQAPHGDTDLGTGRLALLLFEEAGLVGLALNSARRDLAPGADLARGEDNAFVRMALVLSERSASLRTLQLHGFSEDTAHELRLDEAAIVVGGDRPGDARAAAALARVARCLREAGFAAREADAGTRRLAGRGNPVGRALQRAGRPGFIHLELGPAARMRLLAERDARERLLQCL